MFRCRYIKTAPIMGIINHTKSQIGVRYVIILPDIPSAFQTKSKRWYTSKGEFQSPLKTTPSATDNGGSNDSEVQEREAKPIQKKGDEVQEPKHPFVKSMFIGEFDKSVLIYPEMEMEEVQHLEEMVQPIEKYFAEKLNSTEIDEKAKIPEEVLQQLKDLGLFGLQIPEEYGGLALNATEFARIAEITSRDGAVAVTLAAHQAIGLKGILIAGNEMQKTKYLPKLATGELVAAFCLTEPASGSDAASIQTQATLSDDGKTWHLNGTKIYISNGGIADLFTVFAKAKTTDDKGEIQEQISAFIVERKFGGVTNGRPEDKMGIRGSNTCSLTFEDTPVPVENVLGDVGQGFKIAMNILNSGRFSMGTSGAGNMKRLIGSAMEYACNRKQFNKNIIDFGMIQEKFAHMALTTYAMESMAYLTAGMLDSGEYDDCSVEAAIVKVFSSEGCWVQSSECLQILGGLGYMKDSGYERYVRDARIMSIFEGTNEILRLFISLNGLQYAGAHYKHLMKAMGNFWQNPRMAARHTRAYLNQALRNRAKNKTITLSPFVVAQRSKSGESPHGLEQEVHPQLQEAVQMLSHTVEDFSSITQKILMKYKADVIHEQMLLQRLADVCINVFAMTATISRANRSKCIGLRGCDHEVLLANTFTYESRIKTMQVVQEIDMTVSSGDTLFKQYGRIAREMQENDGYFAEHPLKKLW